ncbi:hypothetical protein BC831DRAFT_509475 [Entophlyctis helioformis]|nr:hypothetical protein BC831DRAFT_509475 [Entophlyctis helioformis]
MTRGNARELAREKNQKKMAGPKGRTDGVPASKRNEHDAAMLQAKIEAKKAAANGASAASNNSNNSNSKKK